MHLGRDGWEGKWQISEIIFFSEMIISVFNPLLHILRYVLFPDVYCAVFHTKLEFTVKCKHPSAQSAAGKRKTLGKLPQ